MLEKLKDIFYDKNDIIVALCLVVIGAFIISHQVNSIMSYPEQLADQLQQEQLEQEQLQQEQQGSAAKPEGDVTGTETPDPQIPEVQEPPVTDPDPVTPPVQEPQPQTPPVSNEFRTAVDRTIEIPSGAYSQKIAQILSEAGVVPSQDAFLKAVNDAGLETKLKAGTFKIPAGSTLNDVVKIVTK